MASSKSVSAGEDVEERESFYTTDGNVNWHRYYGKLYGGPRKTKITTTL